MHPKADTYLVLKPQTPVKVQNVVEDLKKDVQERVDVPPSQKHPRNRLTSIQGISPERCISHSW
jgi:hypothetical protein